MHEHTMLKKCGRVIAFANKATIDSPNNIMTEKQQKQTLVPQVIEIK